MAIIKIEHKNRHIRYMSNNNLTVESQIQVNQEAK